MGECRSRKSRRLVVAIGLMIVAAGANREVHAAQTGFSTTRDVNVNRMSCDSGSVACRLMRGWRRLQARSPRRR
jgi:hypothetical protein